MTLFSIAITFWLLNCWSSVIRASFSLLGCFMFKSKKSLRIY